MVRDHDQRIDRVLHFRQTRFSGRHTVRSFEAERLGHNANGQDAFIMGGARDDRSSTRAGASAHTGCNEDHMRAFQRF